VETDDYSLILKNTLNDITNLCPAIRSIFLFREDGHLICGGDGTQEDAAVKTVDVLNDIFEKGQTSGGVQSIALESAEGTLNVSRVTDFYLVTVVPQEADIKYITTLTNALLPTVLKLIEKINPAFKKDDTPEPESHRPTATIKPKVKPTETPIRQTTEEDEEPEVPLLDRAKILPEPQVNQFIVDRVGGLFASSDTVRLDSDTLSQWAELYEDKKIEEVTIETFGGKSARCKLKPIKEAKCEGKGIIQIPEKIQRSLDIKRGELVRVKPVIE
jgi:hypothetical protein